MKNYFILMVLSGLIINSSPDIYAQPTGKKAESMVPNVKYGTIRRLSDFSSKFVDSRNIDIWLPDGYDVNKKYAVLYMHDGQMLFDSTINWNHKEWGVDETIGRLIRENTIRECIVVGIWNTPLRHSEYFPQKALDYLTEDEKKDVLNTTVTIGTGKKRLLNDGPISDNYLKFLVTELKPFIDSTFSTLKDPASTFIAGSSMGGLISMYAICEYPQVFGGAACLSTHWPGTFKTEDNPVPAAFLKYFRDYVPLPKNHRLYFDYGTETLDSNYKPTQQQVDKIMKLKGYTPLNWITKEFPGAAHSETAWNTRFYVSVTFLLGK